MHSVVLVMDYDPDFIGGAQTAFVQQAHAFLDAGVKVSVIIPPGRECAENIRALGGNVRLLSPTVTIPGLRFPVVRNTAAVRAILRAEFAAAECDAVIVHSEFGLAAASAAVALERGIPLLQVVHTFFWRAQPTPRFVAAAAERGYHWLTGVPIPQIELAANPLSSALRRMTLALALVADGVLSPSAHQAALLRRAGAQRVHVVSNAMRHTVVPSVPRDSTFGARPLRLVWIGRCSPEKRLEIAVDAVLALTRELGPNRVMLDIVGSGPTIARVLREELDRSSIRAHGHLAWPEAQEVLWQADALVLTSVGFDNQPMVALEAFRLGKPIVVSDPVIAGEFGRAAILAPTIDAVGLCSALHKLVVEPERLRDAAAASASAAEEASPARHVERISAIVRAFRAQRAVE
ncbi:MAG: hypothetical protein B5766_00470 [Candidatus Lumbricidophila eiseniae]|uniref:Glycosyltransferase subfamily 4-like N-terminal domain-containing protein n=1 Tax=Candidatus Lumbricidiphila eiseniae TaxID=1969409 RepID=A0A2A6FV41_9MICO|nr:MAG: hypothetical protein B5766_00470 [Candidatus Lumbricidophila eiseniae]